MTKRSLARKAASLSRKPLSLALSRNGIISKATLPMHRGRRKRQEARRRLETKKDFIKSELARLEEEAEVKRAAQIANDKKKSTLGPALAIMKDLAEALPKEERDEVEGEKMSEKEGKVLRHKTRKKIVAEETEQIRNVRAHPVFKEDPMEALRQHLVNTVASDPAEIAPPLQEGKKRKRKRRNKGKVTHQGTVENLKVEVDGELEKARDKARERVAEKKERKAAMAETVAKMKRKAGGIEKQTLSGLISKSRGRIGVKRPKI